MNKVVKFSNDELPPHEIMKEMQLSVWQGLRGKAVRIIDHAKIEYYPRREYIQRLGCDCEHVFLIDLERQYGISEEAQICEGYPSTASRAWVCRAMLEMD